MGNGYSYNTNSGEITYNFAAIGDVAAAIGTFQGTMHGALNDLYRDFMALRGEYWDGTGAEACEAAKKKWDDGARQINDALDRLGIKLGASADRMQQVDNQVAGTFH